MSEDKAKRLKWSERSVSEELRTRYRPPSRINHIFFSIAPWIDVALLSVAVAILVGIRTIVPGVMVDLPAAPFREGSTAGVILVVNPLPEDARVPLQAQAKADVGESIGVMIFFNDDRFNLSSDDQRIRLRSAISAYMERVGDRDALLYIDKRVAHGDVLNLVAMLREIGIRRANLVARTI